MLKSARASAAQRYQRRVDGDLALPPPHTRRGGGRSRKQARVPLRGPRGPQAGDRRARPLADAGAKCCFLCRWPDPPSQVPRGGQCEAGGPKQGTVLGCSRALPAMAQARLPLWDTALVVESPGEGSPGDVDSALQKLRPGLPVRSPAAVCGHRCFLSPLLAQGAVGSSRPKARLEWQVPLGRMGQKRPQLPAGDRRGWRVGTVPAPCVCTHGNPNKHLVPTPGCPGGEGSRSSQTRPSALGAQRPCAGQEPGDEGPDGPGLPPAPCPGLALALLRGRLLGFTSPCVSVLPSC